MSLPVPWNWPPIIGGGSSGPVSSDNVTNLSGVPGANVTNALDALHNTNGILNASNVPVLAATLSSVLDRLYTPGNSAFVQVPDVPDPDDLIASRMTDPDLAANGWLVNNVSTGAILTRAGNVDRFGVLPAAGTYQSTLLGGLLFMRTPANTTIVISKLRQSGTTGYTMRVHSWVTKQTPNGSFTSQSEPMAWSAGTSGLINGPVTFGATQSQMTWFGCEDSKWIIASQVQGNAAIVSQDVTIVQPFADLVNYIHIAPGPGNQGIKIDSGMAVGFLQPGTPFSTTMTRLIDRAGLFLQSGPSAYHVIDSLCFLPYLTFP